MIKYHFSTIVSKDHLYRLLAMHTSLCLHCTHFTLFILCADDTVAQVLETIHLKNVTLIYLKDLDSEALRTARTNRIFHAFCWTLKPVALHYVLKHFPDADYFAHIDSDLCFYSDVWEIFIENPTASLYLTHHRNSMRYMSFYPITGIFNTGFVACRHDETALKAIELWEKQCIQSCPIKEDPENRLFGDQRYVEDWPAVFGNVHVFRSFGINAAMWNIENYDVSSQNGRVFLNQDPLIFYHFSGVSIISTSEYNLSWYYHIDDSNTVEYIYKPYLKLLSSAVREVGLYFPWFRYGFADRKQIPQTHYYVLS